MGPSNGPAVTVVVIVQDDCDLLPTAVRSVTAQSLAEIEVIVVDHGSHDGTAEVADRLALQDDRVRVVHLPDREGGPGRPCNVGIAEARAPYVTFVGSDDALTPDACRLLLAAARRHGAELVLGKALRIHPDEGDRTKAWMGFLYHEDAVYDDVRDDPRLLRDQISGAKLYSVEMLRRHELRFPEDVHYEDQLFTLGCYVFARRIAVVSAPVYHWMIRLSAGKPSISHSRADIANVRDRIVVNRRMDRFLHENGADDLAPVKDAKFLKHDLRLYVHDLWRRSPDYQREFIELVGDYVSTFPFAVIEQLSPVYRVVLYLLTRRDIDATLAAWDFTRVPGRVRIDLTRLGDRVYWGHRYLDDEQARLWLDVTDLRLDRTPFTEQRLYHHLTSAQTDGSTLRLSGETVNLLGQIAPGDDVRMDLVLRRRGARRRRPLVVRAPVDVVRHDGSRIGYVGTVDFDRLLPAAGRPGDTWAVSLRTRWNDRVNVSRVCEPDGAPTVGAVAIHPRFAKVSGNLLVPAVDDRGHLSLRVTSSSARRDAAGRALLAPVRAVARVRALARRPVSRNRRLWVYRHVFLRLPVKRGLVLFEAFRGRQFSDSPRAIYETLRETHPGLDPVWSRGADRRAADFPTGSRLVTRGSWAYYLTMARAEFWVDNFGMPRNFPKRRGTTYLQTWHGTPVKAMFFDTPRVQALDGAAKAEYQALVDQWDYLVSPSPYFEQTLVRAANFGGTLIRCGLPRNDALVNRDTPDDVAQVRARLGLPADRRILLFAPTYRTRGPGTRAYQPLDLRLLAAHLGDDWYLLRRRHYYRQPHDIELRLRYFARDVSSVMDVNDLLLASDALLTDFSSVMFDYALLRRPMLFYTPDLEHYSTVDPTTYVDLREVAPGPVLETSEQVVDALTRIDEVAHHHAERHAAFLERFAPLEDGRAASAVVRAVFGP